MKDILIQISFTEEEFFLVRDALFAFEREIKHKIIENLKSVDQLLKKMGDARLSALEKIS